MTRKQKSKKNQLNKIIYFILTFLVLIIIDSYFSDLITENINAGLTFRNSLFALNYVRNTGAAFNIFEGNNILLIGLSVIAIVFLIYYVISKINNLSMMMIFWTSFLLAGIFCNLYERVSLGYVRDFFELAFVDFPIFNISDIFINIGVIAIIWLVIKKSI